MVEDKINLKVFFGYQIQSKFHTPETLKALGNALKNFACEQQPPINIDITYGEFELGTEFFKEIYEKINSSDLSIFDISENNPNVLLESGIALGGGKHVILLKNEESLDKYPTPSDLQQFVYLNYKKDELIKQSHLIEEISKSISYFLSDNHDAHYYYHALWALSPSSKTIIVPSQLPARYTKAKYEDYMFIRRYGDLDTLFLVVETLNRLYPGMDISIVPAKKLNELPKKWRQCNVILIGGPDFNELVREFEQYCPIKYHYGPGKDDVWLSHEKTGEEFKPKFQKKDGKKRAKDYGFFLKKKLDKKNNTKLIFFGGAHTWGVYGATLLVGCRGFDRGEEGYKNAKLLIEKFGTDPSLLVPVGVMGSYEGIWPDDLDLDKVEKIPN